MFAFRTGPNYDATCRLSYIWEFGFRRGWVLSWASLVAQVVKNLLANAGDLSSIPGSGRSPGEGNDYPLQYSCLKNSHGQGSLMGYSPWGCKESDTTEQLTLLPVTSHTCEY